MAMTYVECPSCGGHKLIKNGTRWKCSCGAGGAIFTERVNPCEREGCGGSIINGYCSLCSRVQSID